MKAEAVGWNRRRRWRETNIQVCLALASSPGSPIFSTHVRKKKAETGLGMSLHSTESEYKCEDILDNLED